MSDGSAPEKPEWWRRNEQLREQLDLPEYDPPRFQDGTYVHELVDRFEAEHQCTVRIMGWGSRYPDDLTVYVDGKAAFTVPRWRDVRGNTIYQMESETFREQLDRWVDTTAK